MKAIIEFELPDDQEQYNFANKGFDYFCVLVEFDELLRQKIKYSELQENEYALLEDTREQLRQMLFERGISL
jgi:hypothetical protein